MLSELDNPHFFLERAGSSQTRRNHSTRQRKGIASGTCQRLPSISQMRYRQAQFFQAPSYRLQASNSRKNWK